MFNLNRKSPKRSQSDKALKASLKKTQAALHRAIAVPMEALEPRRMLSVSSASLAPLLTVGTTYTYRETSSDPTVTNVVTFGETVKGPATFNGQAVTELDSTISNSDGSGTGSGQSFSGSDGNGNVISYGSVLNIPGGTLLSTYTPPQVSYSGALTAGVTQTTTDTEVQTITNSMGTKSTTYANTHLFTLQSETPTTITVPAGTYQAYVLVEEDKSVITASADAFAVGGTSDSTTTEWLVPGLGAVKTFDGNLTSVLTNFTTSAEHLAFTQPPVDTAKGDVIAPIKISVLDSSGNVDTTATGSITVALHKITGNGSLTGTLTEPLVAGVATFSDLSVDSGGNYTLTATDSAAPPVASATSATFKITAAALTWTGAGDGQHWSDPMNWDQNVAPVNGDSLVFPTGSPLSPINDITALSINNIDIQGSGYNLAGNAISLTGGLSSKAGNNTYNIDTKLVGSPTVDDQTGDLTIASVLSGDGLTVAGGGIVTFDQTDTYTGTTTLMAGVTIDDSVLNGALGNGDVTIGGGGGAVTIAATTSGGQSDLTNNITFQNGATLAIDPTVLLQGMITLNGADRIKTTGPGDELILQGGMIAGSGSIVISGAGTILINEALSASVNVVVSGGEVDLAANLKGALGGAPQVTVNGGTLKLQSGFSGTGTIDVVTGTLKSSGTVGYTGAVRLEQDSSGGTISVQVSGTSPLGTGSITVGGPSAAALYNVPPVISTTGPVTLPNQVLFSSFGYLSVTGNVTFSGPIVLNGDAHLSTSLATDQLTLDGGVQGTGQLFLGQEGSGTTLVNGDIAAGILLYVNGAGEVDLAANLKGALGGDPQVTVNAGTLKLQSGFSGTGTLDVVDGTLKSGGAAGYSGAVQLEQDSSGGTISVQLGGTSPLGTGSITVGGPKANALYNVPPVISATGPVTLPNQFLYGSGSSLTITGDFTFTSAFELSGTGNLNTNVPGDSLTLNGGVQGVGNLITGGPGTMAINGVITSLVRVTSQSLGELDLNANLQGFQGNSQVIEQSGVVQLLENVSGTGGIEVVSGTLKSSGVTGYVGTVTLDTDGTAKVEGAGSVSHLGNGALILNGGLLQNTSGGTAILDNAVSVTGAATISSRGSRLKLTGDVNITSGGSIDLFGFLALTGMVTGSGSIIVDGDELAVAGSNPNFTGSVILNSGNIKVTQNDALGGGPLNANPQSTGLINTVANIGDPVLDNPLTVTKGTLILQGLLSFPKGVKVLPGATLVIQGSDTQVVISGPLNGGGNINVVGAANLSVTGDESKFTGHVSTGLTQRTPSLTVSDAGGVHTGAPFPAAVVLFVDGVAMASLDGIAPTITYYTGSSAAGVGTATAPSDVGTYTAQASFVGDANYAPVHSSPVTFVISPSNTGTGPTTLVPNGLTFKPIFAQPYADTVGGFTSTDTTLRPDAFTAFIDYGDTGGYAGKVVSTALGTFSVIGGHGWPAPGNFAVTVTINGPGGTSTVIRSTAVVQASNASLTANGLTFKPVTNQAYAATVGGFNSSDTTLKASDFTAQIDYGDTGLYAGTVVLTAPGTFSVIGGHGWTKPGNFAVNTTITGPGGATVLIDSIAEVQGAAAVLTPLPLKFHPILGQPYAASVGGFSTLDNTLKAGDFTAFIDYGDTGGYAGNIISTGPGTFAVIGGHGWPHAGEFQVTVTVTGAGMSSIIRSVATLLV
jgi:fibronectin-binding autotransporter adhesin